MLFEERGLAGTGPGGGPAVPRIQRSVAEVG
jgi:hypothetical protein